MATRVSCAPEEMIISLFMPATPAANDADNPLAAGHADGRVAPDYAEYADQQLDDDSDVQLCVVHQRIPRSPRPHVTVSAHSAALPVLLCRRAFRVLRVFRGPACNSVSPR